MASLFHESAAVVCLHPHDKTIYSDTDDLKSSVERKSVAVRLGLTAPVYPSESRIPLKEIDPTTVSYFFAETPTYVSVFSFAGAVMLSSLVIVVR